MSEATKKEEQRATDQRADRQKVVKASLAQDTMGTPQNMTHAANWKPWEVDFNPDFGWHFYSDSGARHEGFATLGRAMVVANEVYKNNDGKGEITFKSPPSYTPPGTPPPSPAPEGKTRQTGFTSGQNPSSGGVAQASAEDRFKELREDRSRKYGNPAQNFDSTGLMWTGILQQYYRMELSEPIPGFVVALMLAVMKVSRAAFANVDDSYIDGEHYLELAHRIDNREKVD